MTGSHKEGYVMVCIHKKRYKEDVVLLSNPPKHPWTCEKCGVRGADREKESHGFKVFKEIFIESKQTVR